MHILQHSYLRRKVENPFPIQCYLQYCEEKFASFSNSSCNDVTWNHNLFSVFDSETEVEVDGPESNQYSAPFCFMWLLSQALHLHIYYFCKYQCNSICAEAPIAHKCEWWLNVSLVRGIASFICHWGLIASL